MAVLRRALYCTPLERAWIRERAADASMPVSRFVVACALKEDTEKEPGLVLSEEEQRLLYDRVERLDTVRRGLMDALPGTFGEDHGASLERWFRKWMERHRPSPRD